MLRRSRLISSTSDGSDSVSPSLPSLLSLSLLLLLLWLTAGREACAQTVTLTNSAGLDFGRFVANTGGTVVMPAVGTRSKTLGVILLNSPTASPAQFSVIRSKTGGTIKSVTITLPANGSIRLTSGSNSMAVGSFVSSPATLSTITTTATALTVGATLTVAANQPPGSYSGSFPLIINFQ
jgi:hypothetical protein